MTSNLPQAKPFEGPHPFSPEVEPSAGDSPITSPGPQGTPLPAPNSSHSLGSDKSVKFPSSHTSLKSTALAA